MKRLVVAVVLAFAGIAYAVAQGVPYFPQTLPSSTVVGRLGVQPGPTQAIPFSTLAAQLVPHISAATVIKPETYGAVCNGTTDDTAAFIAVAQAMTTAVSSTLEFPINKTCAIWPNDASAAANPILMTLTNVESTTINFNGSKFSSAYTGAVSTYTIKLVGATNVTINDYDHTSSRGKQSVTGVYHIWPNSGTQGVRIRRMKATGGVVGLHCQRLLPTAITRSYNIDVDLDVTDVYYPFAAQFDCEQVRGVIKSSNAGRPYFPYNTRTHDVIVDATNQTSQALIAVYGTDVAGEPSATQGIRARFRDTRGSTVCNVQPFAFIWQQYPTAASNQSGLIDAEINVETDQTSCGTNYADPILLYSYKWTGVGTQTLGDAGHTGRIVVNGLRYKGNVQTSFMELGTTAYGWDGNTSNLNIIVRDVYAPSVNTQLRIGVRTGIFVSLENIYAPSSALTPDGAVVSGQFNARNVNLSNLVGNATRKTVYYGTTSGTVEVVPQATAGTPTLTLPNASGTVAVSASAPLALSATTGNITVTGAAGQVLAGAGPAFTATPTLGVSGASIGTLALAGNTSGTATITPQAAAGTPTITLPTASGTVVTTTETPMSISATTGKLTMLPPVHVFCQTGINMNAVADTTFTITLPTGYTRWRPQAIFVQHASAALNTTPVQYGVFTATGGGGSALLAATASTISTAAESTQNNAHFMGATMNLAVFNNTTMYFRVTVALGSAATADACLQIQPVP